MVEWYLMHHKRLFFTNEQATHGADKCGADWNEQAALKAESYLAMMSFSKQGLIDQLKFEGFTQQEAEYGVSQNGCYLRY